MKKWNSKHVIIILSLLLVVVFVVLGFVMCAKKEPVESQVEQEQPVKQEEPEKEKEPEPTVVGQEKETLKGDVTDFKYGVKKQNVTYNTYDVYSDGSKVLVESIDDVEVIWIDLKYNIVTNDSNNHVLIVIFAVSVLILAFGIIFGSKFMDKRKSSATDDEETDKHDCPMEQ